MSKRRTLVIGVDPGTGASSPTGISVFDPATGEIYFLYTYGSSHRKLEHRIKEISDEIQDLFSLISGDPDVEKVYVCVEQFVIRGKGGESLQRLIGSIMGRVPMAWDIVHVQNTKVKLALAGHGHADKASVAVGVKDYFSFLTKSSPNSLNMIEELVKADEWDILDSLAIGVTGWMIVQHLNELSEAKKALKSRQTQTRRSSKKS